jgi:arylsulfate sulfotransferase
MIKHSKIVFSFVIIFLIIGSSIVLIKNGLLVTPTEKSLRNDVEIPEYDVLQAQFERELEIKNDYSNGRYSIQNPYIIVDPYDMNPGSALVIFENDLPGNIEVTIQGDDAYSTYTYVKSSKTTHFEIPIIGLYLGRENIVILNDLNGNKSTLKITTEPLPVDFQVYKLEKSLPEKMEPGISLFIACFDDSYTALLDNNAQVRGYLSNSYMAHGTAIIQLKNGHMLATGDEYRQIPYNMTSLWEFNWLGKIFYEYEIPNGVHHNISEMPNGDFLVVSNNKDWLVTRTREDVVLILDRKTGSVKKEYDFRNILDENRSPYNHFDTNIINVQSIDWMHTNAAIYNPVDNSIIVSSPIQSQVVAIDAESSKIKWILGPHDGYEGTSEFLKKYLLTPIGEGFEWQWGQHDPILLPDFDQNPETIDLLLLDNGQNRSFTEADHIDPVNNYSRAVQYRIDPNKMTVEQIWQYGKECGAACYATYLGDADYLSTTGNRLVDFGGQLRANGIPVDNIIDGVLGSVVTNSRVDEVTQDGDLVYSVKVKENKYSITSETYQVERLALYSAQSFDYQLGEVKGSRLGKIISFPATNEVKAPLFYGGNIQVSFNRIVMENGRLVADGILTYDGKTYLLARSYFILRSKKDVYVFPATSGLNGRFFMNIDTHDLKSGIYHLSVMGGVREGNDQLNGKMHQGHISTEYKITVP